MQLMNLKQASAYFGVSYNTFKKFIECGLPVIELGNRNYIRKSDIDKFMADHTVIKTKEAK